MVSQFRVSADRSPDPAGRPTWARRAERAVLAAALFIPAITLFVAPAAHGAPEGFAAAQATPAPTPATEVDTPTAEAALAPRVPAVLSEADKERYRKIFALQENGRWGPADKIIAKLKDRQLMGHVLYDRYMHPTKYRSQYVELSRWLKSYADHPGAKRLYKLAVKRRPANYKHPKKPTSVALPSYGDADTSLRYKTQKRRSTKLRREVRSYKVKIRHNLRRGRPTRALHVLEQKRVRKVLDDVEYDDMRARIAAGYFFANEDEKALELAVAAADRSRKWVRLADWTAGLSAWRLDQHSTAASHFERIAMSDNVSGWYRSAGAYWAARSHLAARNPKQVNRFLDIAASHPRTFYGLIALRQLGRNTPFNWSQPAFGQADLDKVANTAGVTRAIALTEIGQYHRAEQELRVLSGRHGSALDQSLLGLADRLNLPATQLRLARQRIADSGEYYDGALYPLPNWEPRGGFTLDRALVYAFMRQESRFNSHAKSSAGARGVMQLMPRTASSIGRDRSLRWNNRSKLFIPEFNMQLGQRYLSHLLGFKDVRKDLFSLAVAYNGGPGNLRKWRRRIGKKVDPLMFIESIPSRESRGYVERVLSNLWIYRLKLGQPTPSLDTVASGGWPIYMPMDPKPFTVASDAL
ncbi:MAG: lytic transglycosylase domain-containing protein [Rhodospirillales bacterium]|nr:lytic transglycosylase domain-containing protein [Rhodospirillales bacterium]